MNALKTALYQLFVPMGRTRPRTFWLWLAVLAALTVVFEWGLRLNPPGGGVRFWGYLIAFTMMVSGLFGVYGKRLKDFGRSVGWIIFTLVVMCGVMMVFGIMNGAGDYIAEFSKYEREAVIDEETKQRLRADYEESLSGGPIFAMNISLLLVWILFTLWTGLTKGDAGDNRYGPAPD